MRRSCRYFLIAFGALLLVQPGFAREWTNPWGSLNPRTNSLPGTDCPVLAEVPSDLTMTEGIYSDAKGSVRDPEKVKRNSRIVEGIREVATAVAKFADRYRQHGDPRDAACAISLLHKIAKERALVGSITGFQAHFNQAWFLSSFALAWLKVEPAQDVGDAKARLVTTWLSTLAASVRHYFDWRLEHYQTASNTRYWAGLGVMAAGVASGSQVDFDWGVASYKIGVDQIDEQGFLEAELKRGQRARLYHAFAITPLVTMAELAQANGFPLYQYKRVAMHKLVLRTAEAFLDDGAISQAAGVRQLAVEHDRPYFGWLFAYNTRFPEPLFDAVIHRFPQRAHLLMGGLALPPSR